MTDLIKFRGPTPANEADFGLTDQMWQVSIECLLAEFEVTTPSKILIVDSALNRLRKKNGVVGREGRLRQEWRGDRTLQKLDSLLDYLTNEGCAVPHWKGTNFIQAMNRELAGVRKRFLLDGSKA